MTECTPQELLPIIPPSVQWVWVAGSGPNTRLCARAAACSVSSTVPGCTRASRVSASISSTRFMYFEVSMTTATLQHCPARLVPPPRASTGALYARHLRFERIDNRFHQDGALGAECAIQNGSAICRVVNREARAAAGMREHRKIDRLQVASILGIAEKHHLLPFDHPE